MKLHEMMQFKSKIEKKRHHFDLPSLPDREWQYMLQRAKSESIVRSEVKPFYLFMCSIKLSFALSLAIILALTFSLILNDKFFNEKKKSKINAASTAREIDIVNISNSSFI